MSLKILIPLAYANLCMSSTSETAKAIFMVLTISTTIAVAVEILSERKKS